jgi:hypothetical protein
VLADVPRLDRIEFAFVAGIEAPDIEPVTAVIRRESEFRLLVADRERRKARIRGNPVTESHAVVIGAEDPAHLARRSRLRSEYDGRFIVMIARLGGLGSHEFAHLVRRASGHLARGAPGDLTLGEPHAQRRRQDQRFAIALDRVGQGAALVMRQRHRDLSVRGLELDG